MDHIEIQEKRDAYDEARAMLEFFRMDKVPSPMIESATARRDELEQWLMYNDPDHAEWAAASAKELDAEFNEMLEQGVI